MMTPCDFNQEDFCLLQDEYPSAKCSFEKKGKCTAKEEDLTEFCEDCGEPIDNCTCGTEEH